MSDPFDDYAAELTQGLANARQLAAQGDRTALQSALDNLRFELGDLRAAVEAASSNAARFGLSHADVAARQTFVKDSDAEVERLTTLLSSGTRKRPVQDPEADPALVDAQGGDKYAEEGLDDFAQFELQHQDTLFDAQDETLGLLGTTLNSLQRQAGHFGEELGTQAELFETFDVELDQTQSKLQRAMGKMDTFIRHTDGRLGGWCVWILILVREILQYPNGEPKAALTKTLFGMETGSDDAVARGHLDMNDFHTCVNSCGAGASGIWMGKGTNDHCHRIGRLIRQSALYASGERCRRWAHVCSTSGGAALTYVIY